MKIKNQKKGMLLAEETLKIVLAVIALSFLVYFLFSLYFSNLSDSKQKQAEANLLKISEAIEVIQIGGESEIKALTPAGWVLFSYANSEVKPNSCSGKDCLCICEETFLGNQEKKCLTDGACLLVDNLKSFENVEIKNSDEGLTNILIEKSIEGIIIKEIE